MTDPASEQPWTQLQQLVEEAQPETIEAFLDGLPSTEVARAVSRLDDEVQNQLLAKLPAEDAADLIEAMPDTEAAELIEHLDPRTAAAIVHELPSNEQADLLGDLGGPEAEAILAEMEPAEADGLRQLKDYPDDVAGGLMITELLAFPETTTVGEVIGDMRVNAEQYRDYQVQYTFVTDQRGRLRGVLRLRDLLLAPSSKQVGQLMIPQPITVEDRTDVLALRDIFEQRSFLGLPVVNADGMLLGLVRRSAVEEALADRADSDYRRSQGLVQEELRTMPILLRARRRLAWLSINIVLNIIAASVIALYQETLTQVIALAVFLPIISDMSGCSGNQAVAVSMRELTLGLTRPAEVARVAVLEMLVGLINGLMLGLLIAVVAIAWKGNPYLGMVVGLAMALNTLIAVTLGGALPLLMKLAKLDPALACGPILTTVTDMCGFFIVLSLASAMLPWLTG